MLEPSKRILCVDDSADVLKAMKRIFMDEDYEVITALSGEAGLAVLQDISPIQIVISDYRMPGMNGVEFLKKVHEAFPDTVRIVLSGHADTTAVVEAINVGQIYRFIPKPWNDDELKITIANAFERYKLYTDNIMLTQSLKKANEELTTMNNDLEKIVDARTNELRFQYAVLERSQVILNSLPVGILGIDSYGTIVYINDMAETYLPRKQKVGCASSSALPDQLNRYLNEGSLDLNKADKLDLDDRMIMVRVAPIKHKDMFAGRVIVIHDGE